MATIRQNFVTYAGNSERIQYTITKDGGQMDFTELTGYVIKWRLAKNELSTTNLLEKSSSDPSQISKDDEAHGVFSVLIAPGDTKDLAQGTYWGELYMIQGLTTAKTLATGTVTIKDSIFAPT